MNKVEFLKDLKAVLSKHNAVISFELDCDTQGIYGGRLVACENVIRVTEDVFLTEEGNWCLEEKDLNSVKSI